MKNKIVREVIDFVKGHQSVFDQVLRLDIAEADELRMEQINLVVGILSKVLFNYFCIFMNLLLQVCWYLVRLGVGEVKQYYIYVS